MNLLRQQKAFDKQSIFANFDNFYHAMGQFTFNMENKLNIITTCLNKTKFYTNCSTRYFN